MKLLRLSTGIFLLCIFGVVSTHAALVVHYDFSSKNTDPVVGIWEYQDLSGNGNHGDEVGSFWNYNGDTSQYADMQEATGAGRNGVYAYRYELEMDYDASLLASPAIDDTYYSSVNCLSAPISSATSGAGTWDNNRVNMVSMPTIAANAGITLAVWVNPETIHARARLASPDSKYAHLIGLGNYGNYPIASIELDANKKVHGWIEGDGTDTQYSITGTGAVAANTWTHIAITYDRLNNVAKTYINGVLDSTTAIPGVGDGILTYSKGVVGGSFYATSSQYETFNGILDDARVYDEVLDASAILMVAYQSGYLISNPSPYNGEVGTNLDSILAWEAPAAYTPTGYNIYLDSSESAVQNATPASVGLLHKDLNQTDTNSILSVVLDANTTYYWRADSLNGSTTITGDVWEFKTKFIYYMAGDINKDSKVDSFDLSLMVDQWLCAGSGWSADIDKSLRVNFADYTTLASQWDHLVKKDYFEGSSSLADWTIVDEGGLDAPSAWQISSGWLVEPSNIYGPTSSAVTNRKGTFAYWNDPEALFWADYEFEVSLKATDNDGIGVMFRYQDPSNYYKFDMDSQRNFRKLFKMYKGIETLLAEVTVTPGYPTNTQMQLKVAIQGNQINVLLDGVNVFGSAITDSDIECGTVALYDWGTAATYFDNFSIDVTGSRFVIAKDDSYDVVNSQTLSVSSNGILANDIAESGVLSATLISPPQHGDITAFNANGTFTYAPDTNYAGQDSFVYEAATANGSDQATVTITVHSDLEFSIVLLPDAQNYHSYPAVFNAQTQWIADHQDEFNIAFVMTEGDFTNHNLDDEWATASTSMSILDGEVPYAAVVGNHDTGEGGHTATRDCSLFNQYFPAGRFSSYLSGVYEPNHMENSYHTFTAGGIDWLVFALEFGPRNKILDWANGIIDANPHRRVIIATHGYMYSDDTRIGPGDSWNPREDYSVCTSATGDEVCNDGEDMWTNFVKLHENVSFVFSGHILNDGVGTLVSTGDNGNSVYQMLANYQQQPNGGNGWLRIVTFYPEQQKVSVKTYSPYLDSYNTAADQQFDFTGVNLTTP